VIRRVIQWLVTVALITYVVWFLVDHRAVFSQRFSGTASDAALLGLGVIATWVVNSLQTLLPLRELGVRVGFWENLLLTVAAGFGNYLPMRAGSLLRLQYIKSLHGVGYMRYGGILGVRALMLLWAAGAVGLFGAGALSLSGQAVRAEVFFLFAGILALGIAPFLIPFRRVLPATGWLGRLGAELTRAMTLLHQNRGMTWQYMGLVALQFGILTGRLAVAFEVMQHRPTPWIYCFLSPVATILSFINITPGNLGLREWAIGLLTSGMGIDYAVGIFAASVDRAVSIVLTFALGGLASILVALRLGRARRPNEST
jgi:uncharacterized membrane protein YbhN (UPF0104 family)